MSADWPLISLAELYDIRSGLSKPAKDFGSGFPFLSFKDVFYNFFVPEELTELVETNEREREACSIQRGDVFLTRTSETINELGMSCVALKNYELATFNGFTKRLRPKTGMDLLPEYVGYYLRSPFFRKEMMAFSTLMSTRASLNNEMIRRLRLLVPPRGKQEKIADVLKSLDDKIELNRQINKTLEQMAQAIFKSWFVDFEPIKAKIEAKQNGQDLERAAMCAISGKIDDELNQLHSDQLAQLAATAALFPDELVESEFALIPQGWSIKTINEVASHIIDHRGKTPKKLGGDWTAKGFPTISAKNIKKGRIINHENIRYVDEDLYLRWMKEELKAGDILLTSEGPMGEMYFLSEEEKYCLSQRLYGIRADNQNTTPIYLYLWLNSSRAKADFESRATGTTVVGIRQSELRKVDVLAPDIQILQKFEESVATLFKKLHVNEQEILNLFELRDTLLPRLLSGEMRLNTKQGRSLQ